MSAIETGKTTICLNMIVRNEAHIIRRCLKSVIPYIDTWVISDTGSTDGTQHLIREIMKDIPGKLIETEWQNFGHNRDEALKHASGMADYVLVIDADEWLECEAGSDFTNLRADSYYVTKSQPLQKYDVRNIIRNDMGWRWKGVIHEYLECDNAQTHGTLDGIVIQARQEGARAKDPQTYRKDAALLTRALADEPDNTRYQFYLAQSWRDAGEDELAIIHYNRRIEMGQWREEVFCSKYQIARAMERMGEDWNRCMATYLDAWDHTPERAEPLYRIGEHYMREENWPLAWLFLSQAEVLPKPEHLLLFIEEDIYNHLATFNTAVAAGYTGKYDALEACHQKLMQNKTLDPHTRNHAKENYAFFNAQRKSGESEAA